ncbi:MAG TPA: radical SAM family heme chaperone HemW [Anaerolineaceae bacterium]|nr:radical SAM family heme chaperone HemW [Anaerolineaceae bacterium]
MMTSLYVHIPFCRSRCAYCDFITYAGKEALLPSYTDALLTEIQIASTRLTDEEKNVDTIYIGGGTPSLISPDQLAHILNEISRRFCVSQIAEITLEANPGTTSLQKLTGFHSAGVNRLSFGVQSFNDMELAALGRIHSKQEVLVELAAARQAGFENISIDLIFGLPGQTQSGWLENIETFLQLDIQHISMYSLILEEETPLFHSVHEGRVSLPDDNLVADMFDGARLRLDQAGWRHYEISNWAKSKEFESAHNKAYWVNGNWLGLGAAAHSHIRNLRYSNTGSIETYIQSLQNCENKGGKDVTSSAQNWQTENDKLTEMRETMMLGFRLLEDGVDLSAFKKRFEEDAELVFAKEITYLTRRGLIEKITGEGLPRLRLRKVAVGVANQVFREFV